MSTYEADRFVARLGRLTTISPAGRPQNSPVGFALTAMRCYARLGREGRDAELAGLARSLAAGLRAAFAKHEIPCHANPLGPMVRLLPTDGPATYAHRPTLPRTPIYVFLPFAHTPADVTGTVAAAERVLERFAISALVEVVS